MVYQIPKGAHKKKLDFLADMLSSDHTHQKVNTNNDYFTVETHIEYSQSKIKTRENSH